MSEILGQDLKKSSWKIQVVKYKKTQKEKRAGS